KRRSRVTGRRVLPSPSARRSVALHSPSIRSTEMRKFLSLTLVAATLAAGGVAFAQQGVATDQPAPRAAAPLGRLDPAQREARQHAMFDRLDADHNGSISYAEFSALRERLGERMERRRGQRFEGFA